MSHTPGPWTWRYTSGFEYESDLGGRQCVVRIPADSEVDWSIEQGRVHLAGPPGSHHSWKHLPEFVVMADEMPLESNARLIAASPAMYAAIKRQVANIERWLETGVPATPEESKSIYEQLKASIKDVEDAQ